MEHVDCDASTNNLANANGIGYALDVDISEMARELARRGRGVKKTMTPAAVEQRKKASKSKRTKRSTEHAQVVSHTP